MIGKRKKVKIKKFIPFSLKCLYFWFPHQIFKKQFPPVTQFFRNVFQFFSKRGGGGYGVVLKIYHESQILVTSVGFELRTSYMQCSYLTC